MCNLDLPASNSTQTQKSSTVGKDKQVLQEKGAASVLSFLTGSLALSKHVAEGHQILPVLQSVLYVRLEVVLRMYVKFLLGLKMLVTYRQPRQCAYNWASIEHGLSPATHLNKDNCLKVLRIYNFYSFLYIIHK